MRDKEVSALRGQLKQTQLMAKAIWAESDWILEIKGYLYSDELESAQAVWDDFDLETQELLITAPSKGGVFTTAERAQITAFWKQIGI